MSKAIEEAAKDFVANYYELEEYGDEISDVEIDNSEECFIAGAEHVLSLPLSQRLTDEERDWIKKIHEDELEFAQFYQRKANSCCNQQCKIDYEVARDIAKSRAGLVEAIFGKELFGEGEG